MAVALQHVHEATWAGHGPLKGLVLWCAATLALVGLVVAYPLPHALVREYGPLELIQAGCWWGAAAVAFFSSGFGRHGLRGRALLGWLGVVSALAFAREFDMHESLNPETLGDWGVRYRVDWWIDASVPLTIKAFWAAITVVLALAASLPL